MPDHQWIGAVVSIILFLFSVINGLAFLINKKDAEKQTELMKCVVAELNSFKKDNDKEHEELFDARRKVEKEIVAIQTHIGIKRQEDNN